MKIFAQYFLTLIYGICILPCISLPISPISISIPRSINQRKFTDSNRYIKTENKEFVMSIKNEPQILRKSTVRCALTSSDVSDYNSNNDTSNDIDNTSSISKIHGNYNSNTYYKNAENDIKKSTKNSNKKNKISVVYNSNDLKNYFSDNPILVLNRIMQIISEIFIISIAIVDSILQDSKDSILNSTINSMYNINVNETDVKSSRNSNDLNRKSNNNFITPSTSTQITPPPLPPLISQTPVTPLTRINSYTTKKTIFNPTSSSLLTPLSSTISSTLDTISSSLSTAHTSSLSSTKTTQSIAYSTNILSKTRAEIPQKNTKISNFENLQNKQRFQELKNLKTINDLQNLLRNNEKFNENNKKNENNVHLNNNEHAFQIVSNFKDENNDLNNLKEIEMAYNEKYSVSNDNSNNYNTNDSNNNHFEEVDKIVLNKNKLKLAVVVRNSMIRMGPTFIKLGERNICIYVC